MVRSSKKTLKNWPFQKLISCHRWSFLVWIRANLGVPNGTEISNIHTGLWDAVLLTKVTYNITNLGNLVHDGIKKCVYGQKRTFFYNGTYSQKSIIFFILHPCTSQAPFFNIINWFPLTSTPNMHYGHIFKFWPNLPENAQNVKKTLLDPMDTLSGLFISVSFFQRESAIAIAIAKY